ncbi:hypothetical protein [Streptomyces sp. NPDC018610]|uniref:hypothetical protein n=1 Tax=Streptomyces sp. NPDC018610 TaxID=3365049 RepID=UPI0037AC9A63
MEEEVVVRALEEGPERATHWSKWELAKWVGISPTSVLRMWRAFGLQPWCSEDSKISPDPLLIDKMRDVVGLYLAPRANAVVVAMDEKSQIQALERTTPVLPMMPGTPERRSFETAPAATTTGSADRDSSLDRIGLPFRLGAGDDQCVSTRAPPLAAVDERAPSTGR